MDSNTALCLKSELDLFSTTPIQLAVDESSFLEIHPIASLNDKNPLEFFCHGTGDTYLDLAHTILHMQVKILKNTNADLLDTDVVAPINYFLNTMFSECSVFLNDKQISSQANYGYRSIFESLLFYSKSAQDTMLTSALFVKDTAGHHDNITTPFPNEGFRARKEICKQSKLMDLIGPLHFDLATQPKLLINGVSLRIKLEKNKNAFCLMSDSDSYKFHIQSAKLYIRKVTVSPSIMLAHERALEKGVIKMPIKRVEVKTFTLSSGIASTTIPNAFIGQIPTRLIFGFVTNDAYTGTVNKNPFHFKNNKLTYLCVLNAGRMIPSKPYQPDFNLSNHARSYLSLFTDLGRYHNSQNININYSEFKDGYTLFAVDMTPDFSGNENHASITKNGNIAIDLKFAEGLPETQNLIVYAQYNNTIEIDKSRGVFTDY